VSRSIKSMTEDKDLEYPVVVKGALCDAYYAASLDEARVYYRKIRDIWGLPVILQRFVEGDEYAVVALATDPAYGGRSGHAQDGHHREREDLVWLQHR